MTPEQSQQGFTLIEILVTTFISILIASALTTGLSRAKISINQGSLQVLDALRQAQSMALSGSTTAGAYPCGYGVTFTATTYTIFAAAAPGVGGCPSSPSSVYTFAGAGASAISTVTLPYSTLVFSPVPVDIFFQPPFATAFIGGTKTPGTDPTVINIKNGAGASCPGTDCRTINVYAAGRIEQP